MKTLPSRPLKSLSIFMLAVLLAAVALLLVSPPAAAQSASQNARLQPLVNALATQLELAFRDNPIEYDFRYGQLAAVVTAWNKSAKTPADRAATNDWFQAAIRASMPGSVGSMPELPALDGKSVTEDRLPPPMEWVEPAVTEDESETKTPTSESPKPAPLGDFELPAITPVEEPTKPTATDESPDAAATEEQPVTPAEESPAPAETEETATTPAQPPAAEEDLDFMFDDGPKPAAEAPVKPADQPADVAPPLEQKEVDETSPEVPAAEETKTVSETDAEQDASTEEKPVTEESSATDLFGDPFEDDEPAEDAPAKEEEPAEDKQTNAAIQDPNVQPASHQPAVNLSEFRARAEGYERGLGELKSELLENEEPIEDQFAEYSRTLNELLNEHEFLQLYFQGLSDAERADVIAPKSADDVISLLNERLTAASKPEFERSTEQRAGSTEKE